MNYYIDTEFLEGKQKESFPISLFRKETPETIDLISIGIVAEDGREYYAISKDFNLREAWNREWIRNNVLFPIYWELVQQEDPIRADEKFGNYGNFEGYITRHFKNQYKYFKKLINKYGKTNKQIVEELAGKHNPLSFIKREGQVGGGTSIKFYAYYADYDWVVFCWLFGNMIELPSGFPKYCIDLKQTTDEVANKVTDSAIKLQLGIPNDANIKKATLKEKLEYLKRIPSYPTQVNEHNALADAKWNRELYKFLIKTNKQL